MTTILADFRLGVIVSDSGITDGDRQWQGRKVHRIAGALLAFSGDIDESLTFMDWWRKKRVTKPPAFKNSYSLVMTHEGLSFYGLSGVAMPVAGGIEAIGSGAKAAMCAYEALGFTDPVAAVKLVCKHDAQSRSPVRVYKLGSP